MLGNLLGFWGRLGCRAVGVGVECRFGGLVFCFWGRRGGGGANAIKHELMAATERVVLSCIYRGKSTYPASFRLSRRHWCLSASKNPTEALSCSPSCILAELAQSYG